MGSSERIISIAKKQMNKPADHNDLEAELQNLQVENRHLKALLAKHGIPFDEPDTIGLPENTISKVDPDHKTIHSGEMNLSTEEKVRLFRSLFRGRTDVYPIRWESTNGKSGYSPACENEWQPGICLKPKIKCGECNNRKFRPVTEQLIYDHLSGKHTIGVYPLLSNDRTHFLAVDFDGGEWREDARAFLQSCRTMDIPAYPEISRSGNGAHVWIFFDDAVAARDARQLGTALISHTCNVTRQLSLKSYDRFFPNQDTLPRGGFGNLIALPLQKERRAHGFSVFVDENLSPHLDQWEFLTTIRKLTELELQSAIVQITKGSHPLDVAYPSDDETEPWKRAGKEGMGIIGQLPESLSLVLANQIFISKSELTAPLMNRLIRIASFQNPEFRKAQMMRLPVWNKPRVICCADDYPGHIGLPRGCLTVVQELLEQSNIRYDLIDERQPGKTISFRFKGELRKDQMKAVREMVKDDIGILSAPTAFGKTVVATAIIAKRKVSTLILVHRTDLARQWLEKLSVFLDIPEGNKPGMIGAGKDKPTGFIDIAVLQSLVRRENLETLLDGYGQIIVDECHHISAFSFEGVLKKAKAKHIIGLTATPIRRDGHQPIIFMQSGSILHRAKSPENAPENLEVRPQFLNMPDLQPDASIQEIFRVLAEDTRRNKRIICDVMDAYNSGRKVLVLTERMEHLETLNSFLDEEIENCFMLHGRLKKKDREKVYESLSRMDDHSPRIILATGRLVGEGFDHPPLDTLILAMPISWKGTLQQYAGRLHRESANKEEIRIYDYIESDRPQLARMWKKRKEGYESMGYEIRPEGELF